MRIKYSQRYSVFAGSALALIASGVLCAWYPMAVVPLVIFGCLTALGVYDLFQTRHSITRNYPVIGHMRFLFEGIRPEIRQYLRKRRLEGTGFSG